MDPNRFLLLMIACVIQNSGGYVPVHAGAFILWHEVEDLGAVVDFKVFSCAE